MVGIAIYDNSIVFAAIGGNMKSLHQQTYISGKRAIEVFNDIVRSIEEGKRVYYLPDQ